MPVQIYWDNDNCAYRERYVQEEPWAGTISTLQKVSFWMCSLAVTLGSINFAVWFTN